MATDRLTDFKRGMGDELKRIGTARRRAASSCNAFAIVTFSSFCLSFFYLNTALSSRGEAARQMYTRGSVICAATIIDPQISPTPPLIMQGSKSAIFGLIADQRYFLSYCSLETEQDIFTVFKLCL